MYKKHLLTCLLLPLLVFCGCSTVSKTAERSASTDVTVKTTVVDPASKWRDLDLKKYPNAKVRVAGYTDSYGDANYNIDLSQRRAKAVAMELVRDGVPAKNVTFIGYGEANPVATNKTAAGRYQNRRVELEITNN